MKQKNCQRSSMNLQGRFCFFNEQDRFASGMHLPMSAAHLPCNSELLDLQHGKQERALGIGNKSVSKCRQLQAIASKCCPPPVPSVDTLAQCLLPCYRAYASPLTRKAQPTAGPLVVLSLLVPACNAQACLSLVYRITCATCTQHTAPQFPSHMSRCSFLMDRWDDLHLLSNDFLVQYLACSLIFPP